MENKINYWTLSVIIGKIGGRNVVFPKLNRGNNIYEEEEEESREKERRKNEGYLNIRWSDFHDPPLILKLRTRRSQTRS